MKAVPLAAMLCLSACAAPSAPEPDLDITLNTSYHQSASDADLKRRLIKTGAGLMRANASLCPEQKEIVTATERFDICANKVGLTSSPVKNAHTNGQTIFVTTAMIDTLSDDELAFIIAHELAHSVAGHNIENGSYPSAELEADRIALFLMARAGFHLPAARRALKTLGVNQQGATQSHPAGLDRTRVLFEAEAEIANLMRRGQSIAP